MRTPALVLALICAGCVASPGAPRDGVPASPSLSSTEAVRVPVRCTVADRDARPIASAFCVYRLGPFEGRFRVDSNGVNVTLVAKGSQGVIAAEAEGYEHSEVEMVVEEATSIHFVLLRVAAAPGSSSSSHPPSSSSPSPAEPSTSSSTASTAAPQATPTIRVQRWREPVTVARYWGEPHLVVDSKGTIYYTTVRSNNHGLFVSRDGGDTWADVTPPLSQMVGFVGDTAIDLAPDDSVWWAATSFYASGTAGCRTIDEARTWNCAYMHARAWADRPWIAGVSATEGFVSATHPAAAFSWYRTTSGSTDYSLHAVNSPHHQYATLSPFLRQLGRMAYDPSNGAVWQVGEGSGGTQFVFDLKQTATTSIVLHDTKVPMPGSLPSISVADGVIWVAGEAAAADGSHSILVGRSRDGGKSWEALRLSSNSNSATFPTIAAGAGGRVAVAFYGSDRPGAPARNGGSWALYVAESWSGLEPVPEWKEAVVDPSVHKGSICICTQPTDEPDSRIADFIGSWIDADGNIHVGYSDDADGSDVSRFVRQAWD